MNRSTTIILGVFVAAIALFAAGGPERKSIADIEADPGRYQDKEVAIAGRVVDSYGLSIPGTGISGGAYKISDWTGTIWVGTDDNKAPRRPSMPCQRGPSPSSQNRRPG